MFDFGTVGNGTANSTFYFDDIYQILSASNTLSISTNTLTIAAAANSTQTFNIQSNVNWTISSNQTWLTPNVLNGSGNATITLTAEMNPTSSMRTANVLISAPGLVPQNLVVNQELGTTAIPNIQNSWLKIYPNPARNILIVEGFSTNAMLCLYDITGKLLFTKKLISKQIDIGNLVSGIYLVRIIDKKGVITRQLVKTE